MALLSETATGHLHPLQPEHVVGRAPMCALRLSPRYVSAQHALLRWTGQRWEVKDLGSTNGTFLDGARLEPGHPHAIRKGSRLAFGKLEDAWELSDDAPPNAMVVPLDSSASVLLEGDLGALPSIDDPRATIFRDGAGGWILEQPDESTQSLKNGDMFEAAGRWWRFHCTEDNLTTAMSTSFSEVAVRHIELVFAVSQNEEHVGLSMRCHGRTVDLGVRSRYHLLLTLARRRLDDLASGVPEAASGWLCADDWPGDPGMAAPQLNLDVYRIRDQFSRAGVVDFANIIERRPLTRQLRLGTAKVAITPA